jgi:hypothetical protein
VRKVLYVPSMVKNLISVGKLADQGYLTLFDSKHCYVFDQNNPKRILLSGSRSHGNSLYRLHTSINGQRLTDATLSSFNLAEETPRTIAELWHNQTAHLNY